MPRDIRLIKIKLHDPDVLSQRIKAAFDASYLTNNGPFLQQFEEGISNFLGIPALAVANGTLGIELVLRGLNLTGKVIVPSFTYVASAHAISFAGLEPLFVDIDPKTFNLDPEKVEQAITPDTVAIVAVHTFGNPCAIDRLTDIAQKHNLPLLFDSAHAFGALYQGKRIGQFGRAEIFSTHATKALITGEGGIVSTTDKNLLTYLQRARAFGIITPEDTEFIGTNAKMSELHAIVGLDSLAHIRRSLARRNEIALQYRQQLEGLPGLRFQEIQKGAESSYFFLSIIIDPQEFGLNRDTLASILEKEGVQSRKYYYLPLHQQQSYRKYASVSLPVTEYIAKNILCLPTHSELTDEEIHYITGIIRAAARSHPNFLSSAPIAVSPQKDNFVSPPTINTIQNNNSVYNTNTNTANTIPVVHNNNSIFNSSPQFNIPKIERVLVTGGAGYVGCVLIKKLLEKGYYVRVLDQLIFGKEPLLELISHPHCELHVGHVEDKYMVERCLENIDAIIHLAGLSNDPSCEINADLTRTANIEATKVLLEIAKTKKIKRLIYASSCSIYGFTGGVLVNEDSPLNPLTAYAKSKVDCEKLILAEATPHFVTVCLRKATIYGPSPRMRFDLVINTMTGMGLTEGKIIINGGEQWRPFVHVEDVADCYIFMLEADPQKINGQSFNVGSNEQNVKIIDLAYKIAASLPGVRVELSPSPDDRSYRVTFDKINTLGWQAQHRIEEGVQGIKSMFEEKKITDFRDLNYFNIKRLIAYLNV